MVANVVADDVVVVDEGCRPERRLEYDPLRKDENELRSEDAWGRAEEGAEGGSNGSTVVFGNSGVGFRRLSLVSVVWVS